MESRTQGPGPRIQKNPRPRTAHPRTDPLEAKDQGHNAKVISKKKRKRSSLPKFKRSSRQKNVFKIFFASSLAFYKMKQNWSRPRPIFSKSKNSAVLELRTGHFRGLAGFDAKDLTFEPKAFKSVPPRGLQLWSLPPSPLESKPANTAQLTGKKKRSVVE